MKTLKFMLEYGCSPIWIRNGSELVDVGLPEDLLHDHQLVAVLEEISSAYDHLFINNAVEFSYKGFSGKEEETAFEDKLRRAIELLKSAASEKYIVEVDESVFK